MRKTVILLLSACCLSLAASAAIPVRWTTDAYKVKPLVYECYHGETLDLSAALTAYGEPLDFSGKTARLYWQTNGMATAWWSTNAFVRVEAGATNVLAAVWSGAYDTGAASVTGFIGLEGENYRAAFELRFRASPGFTPNQMPIPPQTIDWAKVANANVESAPFALKGQGGGVTTNAVRDIVEGYGYVTEAVTNGLESAAHATATYQPKGDYLTSESDPTAYAKMTNAVESGFLCTVAAASAMTNGAVAEAKTYSDEKFYEKKTNVSFSDNEIKVGSEDAGLNGTSIEQNGITIDWQDSGYMLNFYVMPHGMTYYTGGKYRIYWDETTVKIVDHGIPGDPTYTYTYPTGKSGTFAMTSDIPDAYTKTEADAAFATKASVPTNYLKSATSTATSISVYDQTNGVKSLEVQYGYELGAFTDTLASGEIRSITPASSTAIPVTLNFGSDATKAADAMLYVDATALAEDVNLELGTVYTFIGDTGYQTATHGKKVIFCFTRINANTVIANKKEY